jgi:DNA-binding IclR family transcriptional regulator
VGDEVRTEGFARRRGGNPTTHRTVAVLNHLGAHSPSTVTEVALALGMPKSTALGILEALQDEGYVVRLEARGPFALGPEAIRLGQRALGHLNVRTTLRPAMEDLVREFGETCNLGVWAPDGKSVLYVEKVDGVRSIRIAAWVGKSNPCYCTAIGKALLMHLDGRDLEAYLDRVAPLTAHTANTITIPGVLVEHLAQSRERGFTVDDEEHEPGVRCVAVPIRDPAGQVVASLSLAAPAHRLPAPSWAPVARRMAQAVRSHCAGLYSTDLAPGDGGGP